MNRNKVNWKNLDWVLLAAVLCLVLYSVLSIGNTMADTIDENAGLFAQLGNIFSSQYAGLQLLWFVLGAGVLFVVLLFDYEQYGRLSTIIYWVSVALLAALLVLSEARRGSSSWFALGGSDGGRTFQPAEFAKIAFILFMAKRLSSYKATGIRTFKEFLPLMMYILIPVALIAAQPDFGTASVYLVVSIVMLLAAGLSKKIIAAAGGLLAAALPLLWFVILNDEQKERVYVFLDPSLDPLGDGYHAIQSRVTVGSGQFSGKGLFDASTMSQLNYLPDKHTDFIFSVTAESFGFIGILLLVVFYVVLLMRILRIATGTQDRFGALLCVGVAAMYMYHIFENVGMSIGLMPITGIPLPFMSYGGSHMLANMLALGLVLNVWLRRDRYRHVNNASYQFSSSSKRRV